MTNKYGRSGGELYEDNCFLCSLSNYRKKIMMVDTMTKINKKFMSRFNMGRNFARAYYRDEMKAKGLNPDFQCCNRWGLLKKKS